MKLLVRRAESSDLASLLKIIEPFVSPAFHWTESLFRAEFEYADTWVLEVDSEIQAFCCLRDAVDAWEVSVLATRKSCQGQGRMQALLQEIFRQNGRERHYWLEVHESNVGAQKLYEKIGFRRDGARGGYYSDGSAAFLYSLVKEP
jgi:ribosomal-protein-alanine N-acetyltransferase